MLNFWKNISRYPSFFISVLLGLISVLFSPIQNKKGSTLFLPLFLILFIFIIDVLKRMLDL